MYLCVVAMRVLLAVFKPIWSFEHNISGVIVSLVADWTFETVCKTSSSESEVSKSPSPEKKNKKAAPVPESDR